MKFRISLLLVYLLLTSAGLYAWQPAVTNFYTHDYMAGTQNWQIKQHPNGWIYAANNYGMLEYDGADWELYGIWNSTVVRSIAMASDGSIYVGGSNEFGRFVANSFGGLDYQPLSTNVPVDYENFGEVWDFHFLRDELYVQTRNYLFHLTGDDEWGVIEPKSHIYCSALIREAIFVATVDGVYVLAGNQLNSLRGAEQLRGFEVCSMQPYGESGVLIGTDFNGMFLYDGDAIRPFVTSADAFIRENKLFTFAVGDKHIVYGSVLNGLAVTDLDGGACRYVNQANGMQNNTVLSLLFDADDRLWIGLDQGIDLLTIDSPIASLFGKNYSGGSGYASAVYDDHAYFGTNQGLYVGHDFYSDAQQLPEVDLIAGSLGQVWSLQEWGGRLFCAHNRGLFEVRGERLEPIDVSDGFWQVRPFPNDSLYALAGSYNGLYLLRMTPRGAEVVHKIKGFDETSRNFEIDALGDVWIASTRGVEHLSLNKVRTICTSELIRAACDMRDYFTITKVDSRIVISNQYYCRVVNDFGQIEEDLAFFSMLGGYRQYSVIAKDTGNNLWYMVGNSFKVLPYDMRRRGYAPKAAHIINQPYYFLHGFQYIDVLAEGRVVVGSTEGFAMADLDNVIGAKTQRDLTVSIRRVSVLKPTDSVVYGESYEVHEKAVSIPYDNNSLRFEYVASIDPDDSNEYSCRMIPLLDEWTEWTVRNDMEFTHLPEGDYEFELRARSTGSGDFATTSFTFTVMAPWYRSWWFYLLEALVGLLFLYGIYRYFKRNIEYSRRKMARQKDEELRERERQFAESTHEHEKQILKLQNDRAEMELKNKSQELAALLLSQVNKNELVDDVKRDLGKINDELQAKDGDAAKRRIALLVNKLNRSKEQNVDWKKFEDNFDAVSNQFLKKLGDQFPWMSKSERKLCVYIRMGLLNKEIAPLMNLTIRGVEMARYRLRKKMELDRAEDMEKYFQSF